jgi:hypothetical protein
MHAIWTALDCLANRLAWNVGEVLANCLEGGFHSAVLMAFMHRDNHTEPIIGLDYLLVGETHSRDAAVLNALF